MRILAPVSLGELIDKVTILEIKLEEIRDEAKRGDVKTELAALRGVLAEVWDDGMADGRGRLAAVNRKLWAVEDELRAREAAADFGAGFVALARSVYRLNDERAAIKKELNLRFGSDLVEAKSYV